MAQGLDTDFNVDTLFYMGKYLIRMGYQQRRCILHAGATFIDDCYSTYSYLGCKFPLQLDQNRQMLYH